jgi:parvulin-like peptidyl-prolyl isomerase
MNDHGNYLRITFPFMIAKIAFIFWLLASFSLWAQTDATPRPEPTSQSVTGGKQETREINGIAATVNGFVITKKEVAFALAPIAAELRAQFPRRGPEFEKRIKESYDKILEDFIDRELVMSEFKSQGGKIRGNAVEEEIQRQIRERSNGDAAKFREDLARSAMTMASFRTMTERQMIVQAMRASKFSDTAPPLPFEIQKEYDETKLKLRDITGDKMTFLKIYIPAVDPKNPVSTPESQLDLADDIVKQLKAGAKFEELAKIHSRDAFAENGGKQENVARTDLAPEFAALMMDPPEGTIIGPLMDPRGLTIVKVLKKDYGPIPPLTEVHDQIEQRVARQKSAARYERWIKSLRAKGMISKKL